MGALLAGIGCYAVVDKWASGEGFRLENVFDIIFNLAFLLVIIGGIVFIVSTFSKYKCFLKINVFKRESNLRLMKMLSRQSNEFFPCIFRSALPGVLVP